MNRNIRLDWLPEVRNRKQWIASVELDVTKALVLNLALGKLSRWHIELLFGTRDVASHIDQYATSITHSRIHSMR